MMDMNLVMTSTGNFIEVQGTGEEATFTADQLTQMLAFGKHGVDEVAKLQQAAIDAGRKPLFGKFPSPRRLRRRKPCAW